jgi:RHH-type proline utilization regulon transcriptional repressor/proline dehydrogenase/delta 1-pyrroline-5-carboxylate dehydrogenase
VYVNRNMVGAVVGVQPFGGEGLSGTGPKAGGPLYLLRLLSQRPADALARTFADADRTTPPEAAARTASCPPGHLQQWAQPGQRGPGQHLPALCAGNPKRHRPHPARPHGRAQRLHPGPRAHVLCLAKRDDLLVQTAAVLASGGTALWPTAQASLRASCPPWCRPRSRCKTTPSPTPAWRWTPCCTMAMPRLQAVCTALAQRPGPIVGVTALQPGATGHSAGAPADRTGPEREHRRCRGQCQPDDDWVSTRRSSLPSLRENLNQIGR